MMYATTYNSRRIVYFLADYLSRPEDATGIEYGDRGKEYMTKKNQELSSKHSLYQQVIPYPENWYKHFAKWTEQRPLFLEKGQAHGAQAKWRGEWKPPTAHQSEEEGEGIPIGG